MAGKPDESELIRRISSNDSAVRMPLGKKKLTNGQIALLRGWIDEGAEWQTHWSFEAPVRPPSPAVQKRDWPRNPIDHFVLRGLEKAGFSPAPEADRATLLRRLSLDLTGFPPSLAELDDFLDDAFPKSYEKAVDRLLDSPHYGENMALDWLYAARYADTNGYQRDSPRDMWRWRDWVIDAFNLNMGFDQFTIEQLAGDLLPSPTLEQKIATAFNRNSRANEEGGLDPDEFQVEYVADRVETTFTVWQGLTIGCARCHDHKYDPLTQKEYYQAFGYFNNVPEIVRALRDVNTPPLIKAPTIEQQRDLGMLELELGTARSAFEELAPELAVARARWEKSLKEGAEIDWNPATGLIAGFLFNGNLQNSVVPGQDGDSATAAVEGRLNFADSPQRGALSFDGQTYVDMGEMEIYKTHQEPLTISVWVRPQAASGVVVSKELYNHRGHKGWNLSLVDGKVAFNFVADQADDGLRLETRQSIELDHWQHVAVTYDGGLLAKGVRLYIDGELAELKVILGEINEFDHHFPPLRFGTGGDLGNRYQGLIDELRLYHGVLDQNALAILAEPRTVSSISQISPPERTRGQAAKIRSCFLQTAAPPRIKAAWKEYQEAAAEKERFWKALPTVMVMHEVPGLRPTHVLVRGAYDRPGERVEPGVPSALSPFPKKEPNNRLGLARWLVDRANPLTARVTVNRFWQKFFGTGLVRTAGDFGSQGEWPSHPEMLDWLAVEFVDSGWDVKHLLRTILTSATYRQSSRISPELLERDPENRLLARGPRLRLRVEQIRDQVLAISGLLNSDIGGPSVKIYQPGGLWSSMSYTSYQRDEGESLYRRGMYVYAKRTVPQPSMSVFDASTREFCDVRVYRTNTPLQALNLMNDEAQVEASRFFAERMIREGGKLSQDRLAFGFRLATAQWPSAREVGVLGNALQYFQDEFKDDPAGARKLLEVGEKKSSSREIKPTELAAYTAVASLLLNMDKTITKD